MKKDIESQILNVIGKNKELAIDFVQGNIRRKQAFNWSVTNSIRKYGHDYIRKLYQVDKKLTLKKANKIVRQYCSERGLDSQRIGDDETFDCQTTLHHDLYWYFLLTGNVYKQK